MSTTPRPLTPAEYAFAVDTVAARLATVEETLSFLERHCDNEFSGPIGAARFVLVDAINCFATVQRHANSALARKGGAA